MAASKIRIKKICEYCGQEFYALKTSTRFCSKLCNDRAYKMRQRVNTVKKAESENVTVSQERTFSVINQKEYLSERVYRLSLHGVMASSNIQKQVGHSFRDYFFCRV